MDSTRGEAPATEEPGESAMSAPGDRAEGPAPAAAHAGGEPADAPLTFDRHLVLEQLGGWRGMVDATLPTVAFIVANSLGGLRTGVWAALGAASGQARDFFVLGILRNAALGGVLLASIAVRRPLVGVIAEWLAPSHLGAMASHSLPGLRSRIDRARATLHPGAEGIDPATGRRNPDPEPERHWREDPRMVRAYSWLTVLWGGVFVLRALVQWLLYRVSEDDVTALGTVSLILGLPLTAAEIVVTLWVISRLHRHRSAVHPEQRPAD
jgi:hypothetical protein